MDASSARLGDLACLIRSKNAGPFTLTFDVMFDDAMVMAAVVRAAVVNPQVIAELYGVAPDYVRIWVSHQALAMKITIPRRIPSGSPGDADLHGGQQHGPLVTLEVPGVGRAGQPTDR